MLCRKLIADTSYMNRKDASCNPLLTDFVRPDSARMALLGIAGAPAELDTKPCLQHLQHQQA